MKSLDPTIDVATFDALHDAPSRWRGVVRELIAPYTQSDELTQPLDGTVLVALSGEVALKLFPPFLADHFAFEHAALRWLEGRLSVATPKLIAQGERDGWPYLVMSRLRGQSLSQVWDSLSELERCALLEALGALIAEVHAQPVDAVRAHAPSWSTFIEKQRVNCHARQQQTGLPAHLLEDLPRALSFPNVHAGEVLVTGEYTPMNLFVSGPAIVGLFDFGDGLVGPQAYDFLGPTVFLAAGHRARQAAFFAGYGTTPDPRALMKLLLLHRYSNLQVQLRLPGWEQASDFDDLARRIWPD